MIKVGLTGGIGSGKTTISKMFKEIGVPVYIADDAGKELMDTSAKIREKIVQLLGESSYSGSKSNRPFIASKVFKDKALLEQLNAIIHPAVASHFKNWLSKQSSVYIIYEAAILFEKGSHKNFDFSILVTAPKETRIQRVLKRDNTSREQIEARMNNQWSDEKKIELADFVIKNEEIEESKKQVIHLNDIILKSAKNS
ncbi:dephospho-CoA kinase [Zunongwangia atlantica]|uniref:Dephospho-CoA kinase n=1 Tax=Zunongwangia atlantica 22II14-10F7 TaxID=1185767 RepID=A0A1Y1T9V5_9FLAO|nr:dephospho-CoA kinase [Zunongwangia atlantica]ORL47315.1 dephospho-CoA kinase [Zunongwangia atlantica 22II14-10F7]